MAACMQHPVLCCLITTGTFLFSDPPITQSGLNVLRIYALTANPTVRLPIRWGFGGYALAGDGYVVRDLYFVKPVLVGFAAGHMPFMLMPAHASARLIINNSED